MPPFPFYFYVWTYALLCSLYIFIIAFCTYNVKCFDIFFLISYKKFTHSEDEPLQKTNQRQHHLSAFWSGGECRGEHLCKTYRFVYSSVGGFSCTMAKRQRKADCLSISSPLAALPQDRKNVSCQCGGISRRVEILRQQNTTRLLTEHKP